MSTLRRLFPCATLCAAATIPRPPPPPPLPPAPPAAYTLQKLRWQAELDAAHVRSMNVGCKESSQRTERVDTGSRFYMGWQQGLAIWENSTEERVFAPPHSLVEVVHCSRDFKAPMWFFLAPGSGMWFNVGRTLMLHDMWVHQTASHIPLPGMLIKELASHDPWLLLMRKEYDTVQILEKREDGDALRPVEMIWLNPHFNEGHSMRSIQKHLLCGQEATTATSCKNSVYLDYTDRCTQSVAKENCSANGLPLYRGGWPSDSCVPCSASARNGQQHNNGHNHAAP